MGLRIDLTGKTFGDWVVLNYASGGHGKHSMWHCVCSCGTKRIVSSTNLRSGATSGCGCRSANQYGKPYRSKAQAAVTRYYQHYKYDCSNSRDLCFELSLEAFKALITQPCYYCGSVNNKVVVLIN